MSEHDSIAGDDRKVAAPGGIASYGIEKWAKLRLQNPANSLPLRLST